MASSPANQNTPDRIGDDNDDDDNQLLNHQQIIDMSLFSITLSGWS